MIIESNENIANSKSHAIVNTVNCVGTMGKGVALAIKEKYPWCLAPYKDACTHEILIPGGLFVTKINVEPKIHYPIIINLATKNHWRGKSRLEWVDRGLEKLSEYIVQNELQSVSMPRPGCGNGGLNWNDVKLLVQKHLGNIDDCEITIHHRSETDQMNEVPIPKQTRLEFD